jgi:hypothetical protein
LDCSEGGTRRIVESSQEFLRPLLDRGTPQMSRNRLALLSFQGRVYAMCHGMIFLIFTGSQQTSFKLREMTNTYFQ